MNTSELRSDFLIIGFQSWVWLVLLFLTCFGYEWINLASIKDWMPLVIVLFVGMSYPLGIIQNALLGNVLNYRQLDRRPLLEDDSRFSPFDQLVYIASVKPELAATLQQNILQARLIRATAINLVLVSFLGLLFYSIRLGFTWKGFLFGAILSFFVLISSRKALVKTTLDNLAQIRRVYNLVKRTKVA